jgi:uroporphyrinogen decarboxylase
MLRRDWLWAMAGSAVARGAGAGLSKKERVDRAMAGRDVDRAPFSFWHHFGLTIAAAHAARTMQFHNAYHTDIVKVMSDFPYPKPAGKWYELAVESNPFPQQLSALDMIRSGLNGSAYMLETVFNPWNVAQKLSSKEEVLRLKDEKPQALLDALDVITQSEIRHAKRAFAAGADGVLFSVANANATEMTLADYEKFSRPFDRRFMEGIAGARLNVLHLHVQRDYLSQFRAFQAPIINYSLQVSGIPIAEVRREFGAWVIAGGLDEVNFRTLTEKDLTRQWHEAAQAAGGKFILTPGCSVPNDSRPEELARLPRVLGA